MKKLKINKIALSAATAFLMLSSIVSTVASASEGNEITLKTSSATAKPGDSIDVTASLEPDKTGVAGFTINLHYDPAKVEVYVPTNEEMESSYNVDSKFSVITNYVSSSGTIKIVGANLTGTNVKTYTDLALATFKVKDGASGDINYWVDVETMVSETFDGYSAVSYSAPTANSPVAVNAGKEITTTAVTTTKESETSAPKTTTTKNTTTAKDTTTTTKAVTTTTTAAATAENKSTTSAETTAKTDDKPETSKVTTVTVKESSAKATTTQMTETTTSVQSPADTATTTVKTENSAPLFTHIQENQDFNSETALQYGFKLSDYITDYSQKYNVKVNVKSTGNVKGAVGMLVNNEWSSQNNETAGGQSNAWVYENLDPSVSGDDVFLQIYYLKANSDFEVTSIEVTPVDQTVSTSVVTTQTAMETKPAETSAETNSESVSETTSVTESPAESDTSAATEEAGKVTTVSEESKKENVSSDQATEKIQQIVDEASSQVSSDGSKTNPNTGFEIAMKVLTFAAAGEILFSVFAVIYNRLTVKDDEE